VFFRQWFIIEESYAWEGTTIGEVAEINKKTRNKSYWHEVIQYLDTGTLTDGIFGEPLQYKINDAPSRAQRLVTHNDILQFIKSTPSISNILSAPCLI
jgi:type I restriction enzyme S subunit